MKKVILLSVLVFLVIGFYVVTAAQDGKGKNSTNGNGVEVNKTVERVNKTNITFVPWQKRNESECLQGCECQGAVVSCPTETGKVMTITAGRSSNIITITIDKTEVNTTLELEQEREQNKTKLYAKLSNGRKAEVKVMPDTASETALERLRMKVCNVTNNCTIQLKEVGKGEEVQLAYELQVQRHAKILGLFRTKAQVKAEVNAETGELIAVKKPWWAVLIPED